MSLLPVHPKLLAQFALIGFGGAFRSQYLDAFFRSIDADALLDASNNRVAGRC